MAYKRRKYEYARQIREDNGEEGDEEEDMDYRGEDDEEVVWSKKESDREEDEVEDMKTEDSDEE